jgi:hypothetical protein
MIGPFRRADRSGRKLGPFLATLGGLPTKQPGPTCKRVAGRAGLQVGPGGLASSDWQG